MKSIQLQSSYNDLKYKVYKNKLKNIIDKEKRAYYANLLKNNKDNMKKTWAIMKSIVNRNQNKQIQNKFKLNDGTVTSNKLVICEKFNDFFIGIGPSLAKKKSQTK